MPGSSPLHSAFGPSFRAIFMHVPMRPLHSDVHLMLGHFLMSGHFGEQAAVAGKGSQQVVRALVLWSNGPLLLKLQPNLGSVQRQCDHLRAGFNAVSKRLRPNAQG